MGATHPLASAIGFCILRIVDNPIHQKLIFPPLSPPSPSPVPPSSKPLPLEVWYCILYGNTSTMTLRWIQATMDHLSPPHYLTVYSCLHCTSLPYQTGWTPLYYASRYGHVSVAEMLLKNGADVNMADQVKCVGEMSTFDGLGCQQFWVYRNQWLRPADVLHPHRACNYLFSIYNVEK